MGNMIQLKEINKTYPHKSSEVSALSGIDLEIGGSEFVLIKGASGSGKSTLLFIIGGMLFPSSGTVEVNDLNLYQIGGKERAKYRANDVGFVFQAYHLLPYLNVLDNILLTNKINDEKISKEKIVNTLEELGMGHRIYHKPAELSAGEKQRVALVRALIKTPPILLADEPTGNLDEDNAKEVLNYLKKYQNNGGTVVMVTHGNIADSYATKTVYLKNGKINN